MRWFVFIIMFFGTSAGAQSVDQRQLSKCVAESQETIALALAWKESIEAIGEEPRPFIFADQILAGYKDTLLRDTYKMLEEGTDAAEVMSSLEDSYDRIQFRVDLISDMVKEAYEASNDFVKLAEYVTQCASGYGGEFYTQQNEIADLRKQVADLTNELAEKVIQQDEKLRQLEVKHKADTRSLMDPYIKRIETLCILMKDFNHLDVLEKQVFVYGRKYDLCD